MLAPTRCDVFDTCGRRLFKETTQNEPMMGTTDTTRTAHRVGRTDMAIDLIMCPEPGCHGQAEIVDEEMWPSTSGGVFMAKVVGACGHWFLMPAWQLQLGAYANEFPLAS